MTKIESILAHDHALYTLATCVFQRELTQSEIFAEWERICREYLAHVPFPGPGEIERCSERVVKRLRQTADNLEAVLLTKGRQ